MSSTAANEVDVWNTSSPTKGDSPLLGDSGQTSQYTGKGALYNVSVLHNESWNTTGGSLMASFWRQPIAVK
jgi:hypothetical protein